MVGNALEGLVKSFFFLLPLGILGIWKLVEIIVWIIQNISISVG